VSEPLIWPTAERQSQFSQWLQSITDQQTLRPDSVHLASADASFRRYLRVFCADGTSRIIMDSPPDKENNASFVQTASLFAQAGLPVPEVLAWEQAQGFLLLTDLGQQTMMQALQETEAQHPKDPALVLQQAQPWFDQATTLLVRLQLHSRTGVLPSYDQAVLRRELMLFPDWYIAQHRQHVLSSTHTEQLLGTFEAIEARVLASPQVFVHRDYMPRNLMVPQAPDAPLGVLDFQDALYGPITYDIASLVRDAFHSWDEDVVLDVCIRYWEKARKAGLMDFEDWHSDFGAFYRAVEWMGLQRHLKIAGIFARLTLRDGKAKYLQDTPRFIAYIRATGKRYRELFPLMRLLDAVEGVQAPSGYAFGRI
jgi:aminoglycoside/choline kinase family phosphotransferase